jgi:beta-barrel assembly-enhancing protease
MNSRPTIPILVLAVAAFASGRVLSARPAPQTKQSSPDSDLNAIGHRNVGQGVNLYSLDRENHLGKQLAQEVQRSSKLIDDPIVTAYLDHIVQNIAKNSDSQFPITVRVIDSDMIDAFTLPGGFQYINSGLILEAEGEAEIAGVLAHGIAHTALRSSTKEATKVEMTQLASIPAMLQGPFGWAGYDFCDNLNLAIPLTYLKYRRDAQLAADYFGLHYLYEAGYDPESYTVFLARAWPQTQKGKNISKVFSTFPPLPERLQHLNKEIATILPQRDGAIVSTSEFQEIKERLRVWNLQKVLNPNQNDRKPILRKLTDDPGEPPRLMPH